jgi:AcrR family transcriptional regulator
MNIRSRILTAAASVFADYGFRGATTRRIAQRAGVNEVTIFRTFGSKKELIRAAIRESDTEVGEGPLFPDVPVDPRAELMSFAMRHLARLRAVRTLIRKCMSESAEHPEISGFIVDKPVHVRNELRNYLERLRERGLATAAVDLDVTAASLMGVLFADAVGRDVMPDLFGYPEDQAPRLYVEFVLSALGVPGATDSGREGAR